MPDLFLDLGFRVACHPEAEAHIVGDGHVRIERIGLKHHSHAAIGRLDIVHALAADRKLPAGDVLEAGDHPQKRGLAAAGRADEDDQLALFHLQRNAVDDIDRTVGLADIAKSKLSH